MESKHLEIRGKGYNIPFPNVGQLMDIESFKIAYTNGKYIDMAMSNLKAHGFALDVADTIAYLSVLIPDLRKDLKIDNWRNIDPFVAKELVKIFKADFIPWFKPLLDDLYSYNQEDAEQPQKED